MKVTSVDNELDFSSQTAFTLTQTHDSGLAVGLQRDQVVVASELHVDGVPENRLISQRWLLTELFPILHHFLIALRRILHYLTQFFTAVSASMSYEISLLHEKQKKKHLIYKHHELC